MICLMQNVVKNARFIRGQINSYLSKVPASINSSKHIILEPHKRFASKVLDVNTKVVKDVIMYQHENPRLFKMLTAFSVVQYTFWAYLSYVAYTSLRNVPVDVTKLKPDSPWYMKVNLGEPKYRYGLSIFCGSVALITLFSSWGFTVRAVRYLILHKGGDHVSFVTFSPLGPNRIHKFPLKEVSCCQARNLATGFIPIKVKNRRMNFLVDTKGNFRNALLFDNTVGLNRKL